MKTVLIPELLKVIPNEEHAVYQSTEDLKEMVLQKEGPFLFVCFEKDEKKVRKMASDSDFILIASFSDDFEISANNIFKVNGEEIDEFMISVLLGSAEMFSRLKKEIINNYRIGIDISFEKNNKALWDKIVSFCRDTTGAEAGTLYLMGKDKKNIYFVSSQNEKLDIKTIEKKKIPYDMKSFVGYVCHSGKTLNIKDAYSLSEKGPCVFNDKFDRKFNYRTKSILTVPMRTPRDETVGAIQLINKKGEDGKKVSFSKYDEMLLKSLASLAGVSVENRRMYEETAELLENIILSSSKSIEQRDPATKGHSERVARITVALMEMINEDSSLFKDVEFTEHEFKTAEMAAIMHDFGKIGVREHILSKINKLYPSDYERLTGRLRYLRTALERDELKDGVDRKEEIDFICYFQSKLDDINTPSPLTEEQKEILEKARSFIVSTDGKEHRLLDDSEYTFLAVPRGNLTAKERESMQGHVQNSYDILSSMKWPFEVRNVPEYVYSHHEKLDGSGYPRGLPAHKIGIVQRILVIADIYDALTAADRTYKKGIPVQKALAIMENEEVKTGKLDRNIFFMLKDNIEKFEKCKNIDISERAK